MYDDINKTNKKWSKGGFCNVSFEYGTRLASVKLSLHYA